MRRAFVSLSEVVGHASAKSRLSRDLPQVVLIVGPQSVGRRTLARAAADHHGFIIRFDSELTADSARELVSMSMIQSLNPWCAIASLDGARAEAVNSLLKVLEEPPPKAHFFLTSRGNHLSTVESRAEIVRVGLLSEEEILLILEREGYKGDRRLAARRSNGTLAGALSSSDDDAVRGAVLALLRSIASRDRETAIRASNAFDAHALELLRVWAVEARSGRWRRFDSLEGFGIQKYPVVVERISRAARLANHPRIAARMVVEATCPT